MEVEVAVLGSPPLIILMVYNSVDVNNTEPVLSVRAQELCKSRGGCSRLPAPNNPDGL